MEFGHLDVVTQVRCVNEPLHMFSLLAGSINTVCSRFTAVCLRLVSLQFACGWFSFVCNGSSILIYNTVHHMQFKYHGSWLLAARWYSGKLSHIGPGSTPSQHKFR